MGSYPNVYIGPYAVCEVTPVTKTIRVRGCPSKVGGCSKPKPKSMLDNVAGDFCSACGCRIEMMDVTVEAFPSPHDALGNSERLTPVWPEGRARIGMTVGLIFFISNEQKTPREFTAESPCHQDLHDVDRGGEMLWFADRYAVELEALAKQYGKVHVLWGVHYYHS